MRVPLNWNPPTGERSVREQDGPSLAVLEDEDVTVAVLDIVFYDGVYDEVEES